jgi:hypothetical protein
LKRTNAAPKGSPTTAKRPTVGMSAAARWILPPAARTFVA